MKVERNIIGTFDNVTLFIRASTGGKDDTRDAARRVKTKGDRRSNDLGRQFPWPGKTAANGVVHPNIFVQIFPAQGQTTDTKRDLLEEALGRFGQQRILRGGKTDKSPVSKFQANLPGIDPAAHGCGFCHGFSGHAFEYTPG